MARDKHKRLMVPGNQPRAHEMRLLNHMMAAIESRHVRADNWRRRRVGVQLHWHGTCATGHGASTAHCRRQAHCELHTARKCRKRSCCRLKHACAHRQSHLLIVAHGDPSEL